VGGTAERISDAREKSGLVPMYLDFIIETFYSSSLLFEANRILLSIENFLL
jgi:hypothetical protein